MSRPKNSISHGFKFEFLRQSRRLLEMTSYETNHDNFKKAVRSFEKLLHKALKLANPTDTGALQRLASGISALSKAHSVIVTDQPAALWRESF